MAKKKLSFQEALQELEDINMWMQTTTSDSDIDSIIVKAKRAKELLKYCEEELSHGETILRDIFSNADEHP